MFAKIHSAIYTGFSFNIAIYAGVIKPENQSTPYSSGMYKQTTIYATFSLYIDMIKWEKKYRLHLSLMCYKYESSLSYADMIKWDKKYTVNLRNVHTRSIIEEPDKAHDVLYIEQGLAHTWAHGISQFKSRRFSNIISYNVMLKYFCSSFHISFVVQVS